MTILLMEPRDPGCLGLPWDCSPRQRQAERFQVGLRTGHPTWLSRPYPRKDMGPVSDQAAGMRSHSKLRGVEGKECSLLFLPFWNDTPGVSWSIVLWQAVLLSVFSRLFQGLGICGVYPLLTATPIELIAEDRGMWSPSGPCGFSVSDTVFFL